MRFLSDLWLPVLVSGAICFVWSAVAWMVLPHHKGEWKRLATEPEVLAALRQSMPAKGLYMFPFSLGADLNRTDTKRALEMGPVGYLAIGSTGVPSMAKMLAQSFVLYLVTSLLCAYVAWNVAPGSKLGVPYLATFRIVGTIATMAYVLGSAPESIWFGRPWKSWVSQAFDGTVMGLLTAGVFGWLWPQ